MLCFPWTWLHHVSQMKPASHLETLKPWNLVFTFCFSRALIRESLWLYCLKPLIKAFAAFGFWTTVISLIITEDKTQPNTVTLLWFNFSAPTSSIYFGAIRWWQLASYVGKPGVSLYIICDSCFQVQGKTIFIIGAFTKISSNYYYVIKIVLVEWSLNGHYFWKTIFIG